MNQKQAFIAGAIHGANKLVNESAVGGAFMQADFAKWLASDLLFKGNKGKVMAKDHLIEKWKLGRIPQPMKRGLQRVADWGYNNRPAPVQQKIQKVNKVWDKVSLGQFGLAMGDLAVGIASPPKGPKVNPTMTNAPQLQKQNMSMLHQSMENSRQIDSTQGVQPSFQNKRGSTYTLRPLETHELWDVIKMLLGYQGEFMLDAPKSVQLMVNRIARQDSFALVDETGQRLGFINGGYRGLPGIAPAAYYIRFVVVDPTQKGKGLASIMVTKLLGLMQSDLGFSLHKKRWTPAMGVWMQIKDTNRAMQKAAERMSFRHKTDWVVNGKICQIWQK